MCPGLRWEVFEKELEEKSFTQTYVGCYLTVSCSYPLCLFLLTVGKQFHVCTASWEVSC